MVAGDAADAGLQDLELGRHVPIQVHQPPARADNEVSARLATEPRSLTGAALGDVVDRLAVQPGAPDLAGQQPMVVRRDRVLVQQRARVDRERVIDPEDREVRGGAGLDDAGTAQTGDRGRSGREERKDALERDAAAPSLGPHGRQSDLQARDPAPRESEITATGALQVDGARRVVAHDRVDRAVDHALPEQIAIRRVADRRAALELARTVGDLLRDDRQVVRAGLDGQRDALGLGGSDGRQRVGVAQVQDVGARAGAPGLCDHRADRRRLARGGPGGEERVVPATECAVFGEECRILGVHDDPRAESRNLLHRLCELAAVEVRELLDPRRRQEALEPEHPRLVQRRERAEIVGHRPSPEADVDVRRRCGRGLLDGQRLGGRRRRERVEGHVHDRRDTAGRRGERRRAEALPLRAAGLVDVHVRVHQSGQQHGVVGHERGARRPPPCRALPRHPRCARLRSRPPQAGRTLRGRSFRRG